MLSINAPSLALSFSFNRRFISVQFLANQQARNSLLSFGRTTDESVLCRSLSKSSFALMPRLQLSGSSSPQHVCICMCDVRQVAVPHFLMYTWNAIFFFFVVLSFYICIGATLTYASCMRALTFALSYELTVLCSLISR